MTPSTSSLSPDAIAALVHADHGAPFDLLGAHRRDAATVTVRALRPNAQRIAAVNVQTGSRAELRPLAEGGLFEGELALTQGERYQLEIVTVEGERQTIDDPYAFEPTITDHDLYLFAQGRLLLADEVFGAHVMTHDGVVGTRFAVWAPNARRISVIGDFNGWDARFHPMQQRANTGVWELFIPGLQDGAVYRYDVRSNLMGYWAQKSDPYGFYHERRPANASIVCTLDGYQWGDAEWMTARPTTPMFERPMAIYEVHLGSWRRSASGEWLTYRELAEQLVAYVKDMGYTHIELLPVAEHPLDLSWGYQVTGYFAPTSRFGTPHDFMYFVDTCHQHGIGVILDWVPAHFPKDGHALSYFDGTHLYEHADARRGEHPDWGTYIFNYGRNEVRNFLLTNALFWLRRYHIDGLRVDAVSSMLYLDFSRKDGEWLPNDYGGNENLEAISFLREFNEVVHREAPGAFTVAEESTAWGGVSRPAYAGGLGFTYKWNMGWMHDTLNYVSKDPIYRRYEHHKMTFSMIYAYTENFILSLSHDEVVHGKGSLIGKLPGDWWRQFAGLRLLFGYQYMHPGKKLNFMGQEFGQFREWSEARALDWDLLGFDTHRALQTWSRDLNTFYRRTPALWQDDYDPAGFQWIEANDADNSVFSFIRRGADPAQFVVVVANFTPVVRDQYAVGVPAPGFYAERLNSDSAFYGGSNVGNSGLVQAQPVEAHGMPYRITLTLPPLALLVLQVQR